MIASYPKAGDHPIIQFQNVVTVLIASKESVAGGDEKEISLTPFYANSSLFGLIGFESLILINDSPPTIVIRDFMIFIASSGQVKMSSEMRTQICKLARFDRADNLFYKQICPSSFGEFGHLLR